ncbi:hypothetical protein NMY22_g16472 [Coprinellus aureogranulatus]|nr:hypothetical protein NMY22_g16472 [Coprinellus aureogranulatus]
MLLKVPRLPSPPKMHMPHIMPSISDVDLTLSSLPSSSTILASIIALFVLLSFVRALTIGLREHLAFVRGRKAQLSSSSGSAASSSSVGGVAEKKDQRLQASASSTTSSWLWGLVKAFPPSPSSPAPPRLTLNEKQQQPWPQMQQTQAPRVNTHTASRKPGGPAYERPLPTLYQSEMPVSMAKMIMSRHVSCLSPVSFLSFRPSAPLERGARSSELLRRYRVPLFPRLPSTLLHSFWDLPLRYASVIPVAQSPAS